LILDDVLELETVRFEPEEESVEREAAADVGRDKELVELPRDDVDVEDDDDGIADDEDDFDE
jgi:hypothetical protein